MREKVRQTSVSAEREKILNEVVENARSSYSVPSLIDFITKADEKNVNLTPDDFKWYIAHYERDNHMDYFLPPDWLLSFLRLLVKNLKSQRILNLLDNVGFMTVAIAKSTGAAQVDSVVIDSEIPRRIHQHTNINWYQLANEQIYTWLAEQPEPYDVVVGFPPIGNNQRAYRGDRLKFPPKQKFGYVVLANAALNLDEDGIGLFVVPDDFFLDLHARKKLAERGLYINAIFGLPIDVLSTTSIKTNLIVVSRKQTDDYFVAELTDSTKRNIGIADLYIQRKSANDPHMGILVKINDFRTVAATMNVAFLTKHAKENQYDLVKLSEIQIGNIERIKYQASDSKDDHRHNTLFFAEHDSSVVTSLAGQKHGAIYRQVYLDPNQADAEYVKGFLTSKIGRWVPHGSDRERDIGEIRLVLPTLEIQLQVVDAHIKADTLINHLRELTDNLWNKPRTEGDSIQKIDRIVGDKRDQQIRFEDWIDTLPFPLASILWAYHATNDDFKKYRLLQRYFEGLSQFIAIVLLSGFYCVPDWLQKHSSTFNNYDANGVTKSKLTQLGFGFWNHVAKELLTDLHNYLGTDSAYRVQCERVFAIDAESLAMIFPKSLLDVLEKTRILRNEWRGHGGLDDQASKGRLLILENHLNETRTILGRHWLQYMLIKPESSRKEADRVYQHVKLLSGHHNPFVTLTIELDEQLDATYLYLYSPDQSRVLKIQPLMRILEKAVGDENACYFCSKMKGSNMVFISHHYEKEPDIIDHFKETVEFFRELEKLEPESDQQR